MGNFQSFMEMKYLRLVEIRYIQNISAFKRFFRDVELFETNAHHMHIAAFIPFSAKAVRVTPALSIPYAREVLAKHPNCHAITIHAANPDKIIQFLKDYGH